MGQRRENQPPVKLFFALMTRHDALFGEAESRLTEAYGPMDMKDAPFDFDPFTSYYAEEFGVGLRKVIISARDLIAPERLVDIKMATNDLESSLAASAEARPAGRAINIDPGYLSHSKVILATTKDQAHRIYIGRGIFEEITLSYRRSANGFEPNPWTYPDYRAPERLDFFGQMRQVYCGQVKAA